MRYEKVPSLALVILSGCFLIAVVNTSVFAQSTTQEKPTLKEFGRSLKRLKWDSKKQEAVEVKDKNTSGKASDEEDVIKIETTLVVSDVLVLDKKGFSVTGLTQKDFIVTEDGKEQEIGVFSLGSDADVSRSIVLIIDNSSSLLSHPNQSVEAAKKLVDKLKPRDRMAIVTDRVKLLSDFTNNKVELKNKLESFKDDYRLSVREGKSRQYSALLATLRELFDEEDIRPIIILQADGDELVFMPPLPKDALPVYKDYAAQFSLKDVFAAVEKSRATIYGIYPGYRLNNLLPNERLRRVREHYKELHSAGVNYYLTRKIGNRVPTSGERTEMENLFVNQSLEELLRAQPTLESLSRLTGGWTEYLEDPSQADEIYTRILTNIDNRYVIGYYPANTQRDGKRRNVKVEVRGHPEYTVIGRKTYLAPKD